MTSAEYKSLGEALAALNEKVSFLVTVAKEAMPREMCEERYRNVAERLEHLECAERRQFGFRHRLQGMAVPVAICLGVISLILAVVGWQ